MPSRKSNKRINQKLSEIIGWNTVSPRPIHSEYVRIVLAGIRLGNLWAFKGKSGFLDRALKQYHDQCRAWTKDAANRGRNLR